MCAHGLSGRIEINGRTGTIIGFDAYKGRYAVAFEGGEAALLKPQNLCPVAGS